MCRFFVKQTMDGQCANQTNQLIPLGTPTQGESPVGVETLEGTLKVEKTDHSIIT